jgi:SpoIIAA-like
MLSYEEMDNLAAVEIEISDRVSTEEFDQTAKKLEAFIARHGRMRVLEIVNHFEGMDVKAFWLTSTISAAAPSFPTSSFCPLCRPSPSRSSTAKSRISSLTKWKPRGAGCYGLKAQPTPSEIAENPQLRDLRSFP